MAKKVTIRIEGKEYELELQDDFGQYMTQELEKKLPHANNSIKELLNAYLQKCYECFMVQKEVESLLKKV